MSRRGAFLKATAYTVTASIIILTVATYIGALMLGPYLFFLTDGGKEFSSRTIAKLPIGLFMLTDIRLPISPTAGTVFLTLWLLYASCFVVAWTNGAGLQRSIRCSLDGLYSELNYLAALPLISSALYAATRHIHTIQELLGIRTGGITFPDPLSALLSLSYAPFYEELSYRISPIGTAVAIHAISSSRSMASMTPFGILKTILAAWLDPDRLKAKLGMRNIMEHGIMRGASPVEWAMVILTSSLFGLAHYLSGGGWQLGKITTAMISGFALAFVYLKYGAFAPILLHWFFNYYFTVFDMVASLHQKFLWPLIGFIDNMALYFGTSIILAAIAVWIRRIRKRITAWIGERL